MRTRVLVILTLSVMALAVAPSLAQFVDPDRLEILPAPWPDGEVMRLTLKLASGTPIGAMLMSADAIEQDGEELWRLRVRRKVFSDTDNQAISQVLAKADTMAPVSSVFRHSIVGHFEAQYGDGVASIDTIGVDAKRQQPLKEQTFDNEEGFHIFRRLPLEVGYKRTIKVVSLVAGGVTPVDFEITKKEIVTVPAGEIECYRMEFSVPQVLWYSTDSRRVLVKFEAAGVVGELDEVYVQEPGAGSVYRDEELGFSVALPPDWLFQTLDNQGTEVVFLLDPKAQAQARMEIRRAPGDDGLCFFQAAAHRKVEQARAALKDYTLREGAWTEREVAGWPLVSFLGDYREIDREKVHYWTFIENDGFCVDFTLKVSVDRFEALRTVFDEVIESYDGPPPRVPEVSEPEAVRAVRSVLTDFHTAAATADPQRFFEHLASDAIFFGPGAPERFGVEQLRARFADAIGWMAGPSERHVVVSRDGTLAWFDQRLASRQLGELRASGVLRGAGGGWKIVQYHVAMPVPNQLVAELVPELRAHDQEVGREPVDFASPPAESVDPPAGSARWLLRDVHRAKAAADADRYFGSFAPEAVILGTARSERLTPARMRALVGPYYARGHGPISIPIEQHVYLSPNRDLAWFDELVERKNLGLMRGTGVMRQQDGGWEFVHYNLVIVVPPELAEDFARRIDAFYASR